MAPSSLVVDQHRLVLKRFVGQLVGALLGSVNSQVGATAVRPPLCREMELLP